MFEYAGLSLLGGLIGSFTMYLIAKRAFSKEKIMNISQDIVDESLDRLVNEPEMQKRLYLAGVIVGQGIKQGVGINTKGGKFKMENIIGEAIGAIIKNVIPSGNQPTEPAQVLIPEHLR